MLHHLLDYSDFFAQKNKKLYYVICVFANHVIQNDASLIFCLRNYLHLMFGSSSPSPFLLSTTLRNRPMTRAATPRQASIMSGAV